MNYKVGFITSEQFGNLTESEREFSEFVKDSGIIIEPVIWSNINADYSKYDLAVIRSCWDYHVRYEEFVNWLNLIEEQNVYVLNSVKTVRGNLHKFYLRELLGSGVKILDTVFANKNARQNIEEILEVKKWNKAVFKPAVSGSAYKTYLVSKENTRQGQILLNELLKETDVLVQQYAAEIISKGEWSLIFFNKRYSHAVLKHPKEKDFRVQEEHGGSYTLKEAPKEIIKYAESIVDIISDDLLYARVDGVLVNGEFRLMELELIEPEIFLLNKEIMKTFAEAILEQLKKQQRLHFL